MTYESHMSCKGASWCGVAEARARRVSFGIKKRLQERSSLWARSLLKEMAAP